MVSKEVDAIQSPMHLVIWQVGQNLHTRALTGS